MRDEALETGFDPKDNDEPLKGVKWDSGMNTMSRILFLVFFFPVKNGPKRLDIHGDH